MIGQHCDTGNYAILFAPQGSLHKQASQQGQAVIGALRPLKPLLRRLESNVQQAESQKTLVLSIWRKGVQGSKEIQRMWGKKGENSSPGHLSDISEVGPFTNGTEVAFNLVWVNAALFDKRMFKFHSSVDSLNHVLHSINHLLGNENSPGSINET